MTRSSSTREALRRAPQTRPIQGETDECHNLSDPKPRACFTTDILRRYHGCHGQILRPRSRVVAALPFAARTRFVFARPAQGPRLFGRRGWRNRKAVLEEVTIQGPPVGC